MALAGDGQGYVVDGVVDDDGNVVVPAAELPGPLAPGAHVQLRVVTTPPARRRPLYGSLPGLPELTWTDFQRASRLAVADVEPGAARE
jgi:hypothetical protein